MLSLRKGLWALMRQLLYIMFGIILFQDLACKPAPSVPQQANALRYPVNDQAMQIEQGLEPADTNRVIALIKHAKQINRAAFPDSAMALYKQVLQHSYALNFDNGIAIALLLMGYHFYEIQTDYPRARALFFRAVPYTRRISNKKLLPNAYIWLGNTYFQEGNHDSANYYYYKTLGILLEMKPIDTQQLIHTYMNIGAALQHIDTGYERALEYSREARQLAFYQKDTSTLVLLVQNIGTLFNLKGNYDSAFAAYVHALQLAKIRHVNREIQNAYNYVAAALLNKKDLDMAKLYLDSAVNADKQNAESNIGLLQNLGCVYYYSGAFTEAIPYYEKAIDFYNERGENGNNKLVSYGTLSNLYDSLGQWRLAYKYQKAYSALWDSLINEDKLQITNQMEVKYRSAEKDRLLARKDLEILKAQTQSQRTIAVLWISSLCIALLIGSLIFFRYRQVNKLRQVNQQKELDILKASMTGEEAERIRVGQELHDGISGLLSAIKMNLATLRMNRQDIADERNFITTMQLADEAADELRKTAHNLVSSNLGNKGLFKAIQGFCERVTSPELDLQVTESGSPVRLDPAKELIIYRNIQELVHNMIRHAQATKGQIALSWQDNLLFITVEDNGTGISSEPEGSGIGFENIRNSIKKLRGSLEIDSKPGEGTSIYLEYPI